VLANKGKSVVSARDSDTSEVEYLKVINDGRILASWSKKSTITLWDLESSKSTKLDKKCTISSVKTKPNIEPLENGNFVFLNSGFLEEYAPNCKIVKETKTASGTYYKSLNSQYLATGVKDKIEILDMNNKFSSVHKLSLNGTLKDLDVSANHIFASNTNGLVFVWDKEFNFVNAIKGSQRESIKCIDDNSMMSWTGKQMCVTSDITRGVRSCQIDTDSIKQLVIVKSEYLGGVLKSKRSKPVVSWLTLTSKNTLKRWTFSQNVFSSQEQKIKSPSEIRPSFMFDQLNRNALFQTCNFIDYILRLFLH
jgi:WD40 repeat protein